MGEGRARCPAVPAPGRRRAAGPTGRPEARRGGVTGAGAVGCPGQRRKRYRRIGRGVYVAGRTGPVKFITQADAGSHRFV